MHVVSGSVVEQWVSLSDEDVVARVSEVMTLLPGDVIATGTPPGVGLGMKPPVFLKPGDVMTLTIEGLGQQRQKVVPYSAQ